MRNTKESIQLGDSGVCHDTSEDVGARCVKVSGHVDEDIELIPDGIWKIINLNRSYYTMRVESIPRLIESKKRLDEYAGEISDKVGPVMITHIMRNTATVATDGATSNDRVTKSNLLKFNQISEYLILKMYNVLVKKRYNINVKEAIDKRYSWNCLP